MTAKSSASGPELTITFTRTAGWSDFLKTLEGNQDWLETTTVADYLSTPPGRRTHLSAHGLLRGDDGVVPSAQGIGGVQSLFGRERAHAEWRALPRFLRGGLWRNFLTKYAESNQHSETGAGRQSSLAEAEQLRGKWNGKGATARGSAALTCSLPSAMTLTGMVYLAGSMRRTCAARLLAKLDPGGVQTRSAWKAAAQAPNPKLLPRTSTWMGTMKF